MDKENRIKIADLINQTNLSDTDILMIEDSINTKKITVRNFVSSIIKDNEVPTAYRLYSSLKIQNLIDELDERIVDGIGGVEGDIDDLEALSATKEELKKLKEEIDKDLETKADEELMIEQLGLMRKKTDKISASELDTSSNDSKIQPKNLSQEVINMMTGATTIPTNKAPIGGWVTEDIADSAIVSNKLKDNFRHVKDLSEGNINELTKDGWYLLGSDIIGLPKEDPEESDIRLLNVERISDNYIIQTVYYTVSTEEHTIYRRRCEIDRIHVTPFGEVHELSPEYRVGREMLKSDFSNNGVISSGSVFVLRDEGNYYVRKTCTDLPTNDDYMVNISNHGNYYIFTASIMDNTTCEIYKSLLYFTSGLMPVTTGWFNVSNSKKSKFDGENVCLFGDGILFGIGSDDITNNSIPAILSKKYGMKITNRSIGDATIGNYEDEQLMERSIIKQIETTPLDNMDYIIIFAGTNDWKIGKAGFSSNNTVISDKTFNGSINKCISDIAAKNPRAKVVFCTPIFRARIDIGDNKNSDTNTVNDRYLSEYASSIETVCKLNHIPVINLYDMGTINKYNSTVYLKDGLYPNDEGNNLLASKIVNAMESLF